MVDPASPNASKPQAAFALGATVELPPRNTTGVRIPPTVSHDARPRNNIRVASSDPVDHNESNILDLRKKPSELTVEERSLAAMFDKRRSEGVMRVRIFFHWRTFFLIRKQYEDANFDQYTPP